MPLVFKMLWTDSAYPIAKLLKFFESEGVPTEEIWEFHENKSN